MKLPHETSSCDFSLEFSFWTSSLHLFSGFLFWTSSLDFFFGLLLWTSSLDFFFGSLLWISSLDLSWTLLWISSLDLFFGSLLWTSSLDFFFGSLLWISSLDLFFGSLLSTDLFGKLCLVIFWTLHFESLLASGLHILLDIFIFFYFGSLLSNLTHGSYFWNIFALLRILSLVSYVFHWICIYYSHLRLHACTIPTSEKYSPVVSRQRVRGLMNLSSR